MALASDGRKELRLGHSGGFFFLPSTWALNHKIAMGRYYGVRVPRVLCVAL